MKAVLGIFIAAFLACLFLWASIVIAAGISNPGHGVMNGVWEGRGKQSNGEKWTIQVTIDSDQYSIRYPSLKCAGTLEVVEKTAGYLRAVEHITHGGANCYNGGILVLIWTNPGEMDYLWYYPDGSNGAVGELRKVR